MSSLTGKQRRALRALGHHLSPIVMLGKEGISAAVIKSADGALGEHELVKVKVQESFPVDRHQASEELAQATNSQVAQVLGRTFLLFRRHPDAPKIEVPGMPLPPPKPKKADASAKKTAKKVSAVRKKSLSPDSRRSGAGSTTSRSRSGKASKQRLSNKRRPWFKGQA